MSCEKKEIKICEIDWETDGQEVELPDAVTIDAKELDEEELADAAMLNEAICNYLSGAYGWLINGYTHVEDKKEEEWR